MVTRKTLNETILNDDVTSLINLELLLARNYSTDETTRRQFNRNWNVYNMASAQENFTFITWSDYIYAVSLSAQGVNLATRRYVIMEPDMLIKLGNAITTGVFTGTQVVNYFFFRLLASQSD